MKHAENTLKALIADDEQDLTSILAARLRAEGIEVHLAGDGKTAVEEARRWRPDVVLADVSMPGLDGWQVCEALRADARTARTPVLIMTAWATPDLERRAKEGGAAGFLVKPFDERRLAAALRSVAYPRRRRRPS